MLLNYGYIEGSQLDESPIELVFVDGRHNKKMKEIN